jgi:hypothetical protein
MAVQLRSEHRQTEAGAIESEESVVVPRPVVAGSPEGARRLGDVYWSEVEAFTRGLVRARRRHGGIELALLGRGPSLLRIGAPLVAAGDVVSCRYAIEGGLLARAPAGEISFAQSGAEPTVLRAAITGFFPRLAARPGRPLWTGAVYAHAQARLHVAVSRRYFARLIREAGS